jgi:carboxypeptidase C (cathepsin A)
MHWTRFPVRRPITRTILPLRAGRATAATVTAALFALQASASAQVPQALIDHQPSVAVTKQTGTFGGRKIPYSTIVEEHILKGRDSVPSAFLVTIAYVRDDVPDKSKRPVAFVFNGGPGASSSPLHFGGIGPRVGTRDGNVENPHSILDVIDLVFIDPVGTGFSRPYTTELGKQLYWNLDGDAASVSQVIRRWLAKYGRLDSPRYMIGESYGTTRIGAILKNHKDLKFDGVVLVSTVAGNLSPAMSAARNIPAMAVAAWYHEKTPKSGRTAEQVWDEATRFARQEYIPALSRGDSLAAVEKSRIAQRLSSLIGLPASFIEEKNLRPSAQDWLLNILKDKGLRVSNQDTRVTGPLVLSAEQAASSSPAEGLGGTRIGTAMQAPALVPGSPEANAMRDSVRTPSALESYLKRDLQFKTLEAYRSLNLDINGFWRAGGNQVRFDAAPNVAEGMRANPAMRMFWIQGYYDLNTPATGALLSFEEAGLTGERVSGMMAPGPHTAFATDESKQALAAALRKWIH